MKARIAFAILWFALALGLICHGQFGSFRMDQPFLAGPSGPCAGITMPQDEMTTYTLFSSVNGMDDGCLWAGPYVAHEYENLPAIWMYDDMDTYADGLLGNGMSNGVNWFTEYRMHSYVSIPYVWYVDAMDEYTNNHDFVTNQIGLGTNFVASQITNQPVAQAWTDAYVGHGY